MQPRLRGALVTLEQCSSCVAEADALPVAVPAVDELRAVVADGAQWETAACALLGRDPAAGADELEALLQAAAPIKLELPSRERAHDALAASRWQRRHDALAIDGAAPQPLSVLISLLKVSSM